MLPHAEAYWNKEVAARIAAHFCEVIAELDERRTRGGVQHPALDHYHVHVDRADLRLRQALTCTELRVWR